VKVVLRLLARGSRLAWHDATLGVWHVPMVMPAIHDIPGMARQNPCHAVPCQRARQVGKAQKCRCRSITRDAKWGSTAVAPETKKRCKSFRMSGEHQL